MGVPLGKAPDLGLNSSPPPRNPLMPPRNPLMRASSSSVRHTRLLHALDAAVQVLSPAAR